MLGRFSVEVGGTDVPEARFVRKKSRALLKLLAIQPSRHLHRDQAMDALWPDLDLQAASAQLYKAVHHIRQALGADPEREALVEFRAGLLRLGGEVETDVAAFERLADLAVREPTLAALRAAVAAYTGELLPADRYEEWTLGPREALGGRHVDLLVRLGAALLQAGVLAEAADAYRQALAVDPTREDGHRGLMQVYALEGNRDRAIRQFRICEEVLDRELGARPSVETTALREEIETAAVPRAGASDEMPGYAARLLTALIGREAETAILRSRLDALADGTGGWISIAGPAGIGKTRLAHEVLQQARARGYGVAYGSARSGEGRLSYAPLIDAVRMALRADPTGTEHIPAELGIALPDVAVGAPAGSADRVASRNALFRGMLRFLQERARRTPLVVVLDDLHAADEGTLAALTYLARRIASASILLVACRRTDEPSRPALDTLMETAPTRILLGPLSPREHETFLADALGGPVDAKTAEVLHGLGGGHPLFTAELVHQLSAAGRLVRKAKGWSLERADETVPVPSSLHGLLRERIAAVSDAGLGVLGLAAVIGEAIPLPLLQACARGEELLIEATDPLLDLVSEAVDARLLEEAGLGYRFTHPLLREAVVRRMRPLRRQALHRRVARTLEAERPEAERPVETLAHHYRESGDLERAVHYLIAAGDRAESVYDHETALTWYGDALALLPRGEAPAPARIAEIHERIGDVHRLVGHVEASSDAYTNALAATAEDGREGRPGLHRKMALGAIMAADVPAAFEHLANARANPPIEELDEARNLIVEALIDWHVNRLEDAVGLAERALEIAERAGAEREIAQACEMLALAHLPQGNWEEGLRYELRREADWSPDLVLATDAHMCLWEYRIRGEDPHRRAKAFIDGVTEQAASMGNLRCLAVCHYALGSIGLARGDFHVAREQLERSLDLHQALGSPAGVAFTAARLLALEADVGGRAGADLFDRALEAASEAAVRDHALMNIYGAGMRSRLSVGDVEGATRLLATAERLEADGRPCPICSLELLPVMAAVYLERGDVDAASRCAERGAELAASGHNAVGAARSAATRGRVHLARGEIRDAARALAGAADAFRDLGHRFELAVTLQARGSLPGGADAEVEAQAILATMRL
ncbi:MAG: AAA family ATPase [Actinomycetota bacterium]